MAVTLTRTNLSDLNYRAVDTRGKRLKPIPYREMDLNVPSDTFDLARTHYQRHSEICSRSSEHAEKVGIVVRKPS